MVARTVSLVVTLPPAGLAHLSWIMECEAEIQWLQVRFPGFFLLSKTVLAGCVCPLRSPWAQAAMFSCKALPTERAIPWICLDGSGRTGCCLGFLSSSKICAIFQKTLKALPGFYLCNRKPEKLGGVWRIFVMFLLFHTREWSYLIATPSFPWEESFSGSNGMKRDVE